MKTLFFLFYITVSMGATAGWEGTKSKEKTCTIFFLTVEVKEDNIGTLLLNIERM